MKKAGQILKELGFREDAPDSLKEAFVRHLIKSATGQVVEPGPHEKKELIQKKALFKGDQLEFNFSLDFVAEVQTFDETKGAPNKKIS
jgi:hypothetical protein